MSRAADEGTGAHQRIVERLSRELVARQHAAREELEALRAENRKLRRRVERRSRSLRRVEAELAAAEDRLDQLRASETWRVGTAALWLPRRVGKALRRR